MGQCPDVANGRHIPPQPDLLASIIRIVNGVFNLIDTNWVRKEGSVHGIISFLDRGGAESLGGLCALHMYERCSIALGEAGVGVLMAGTTLQS